MPKLTGIDLDKALNEKRLVVTPMLDRKVQVAPSFVYLRLGNEFLSIYSWRSRGIDLDIRANQAFAKELQLTENKRYIWHHQEHLRVQYGEEFVIHPGQQVLGSTLEYVGLHKDLVASAIARSSWGRIGLIVTCSEHLVQGYRGSITLQMTNVGSTPVTLYPGIKIVKLLIDEVKFSDGDRLYNSRYAGATGPRFSMLLDDVDDRKWTKTEIEKRLNRLT